jgi:hypothetical protein
MAHQQIARMTIDCDRVLDWVEQLLTGHAVGTTSPLDRADLLVHSLLADGADIADQGENRKEICG